MNNKHLTSLELSKKLKAIGVPESSEFYWGRTWGECVDGQPDASSAPVQYELTQTKTRSQELWGDGAVSAFLSSELGELFPNGMRLLIQSSFCLGTWSVELLEIKTLRERKHLIQSRISEAEARGKMLKYLVEHGLITF